MRSPVCSCGIEMIKVSVGISVLEFAGGVERPYVQKITSADVYTCSCCGIFILQDFAEKSLWHHEAGFKTELHRIMYMEKGVPMRARWVATFESEVQRLTVEKLQILKALVEEAQRAMTKMN